MFVYLLIRAHIVHLKRLILWAVVKHVKLCALIKHILWALISKYIIEQKA